MIFSGTIYDNRGVESVVKITTDSDTSSTIIIGDDNYGIYFAGDEPVIIEEDVDTTFETIIKKSCTINFVTNSYKGADLFAKNSRNIKVEVSKNGNCLFAGYVEPNTFSQPWGENTYDSFSINAVDYLSTIENYQYSGITTDTALTAAKNEADSKSFKQLLDMALDDFKTSFGSNYHIYYDLSKGTESDRTKDVFNDLAISESYIIGDELDDVWSYEDVLTEMLKYMNLHIVQNGYDFYIFDWKSIKDKKTIWYDLNSSGSTTYIPKTITLSSDMMMDNNTNITVNEVYSQLSLTDDIEDVDDLIVNPLDSNSLYSPYKSKFKHCLEMVAVGDGDSANQSINDQVKGGDGNISKYGEEAHYQYEWYQQPMLSKNWKLQTSGGTSIVDLFPKDSKGEYYKNWYFPQYVRNHQLVPAIFRLGYVKKKSEKSDNSLISSIDTSDYLYISVNGNEDDTLTGHSPSDLAIANTKPLITYTGKNTGAIYTPASSGVTNYIVFKGELLLQPVTYESDSTKHAQKNGTFWRCYQNGVKKTEQHGGGHSHETNTIHFTNLANKDGAYYVRKFWNHDYASDQVNDSGYTNVMKNETSLQPYSNERELYEYKFNGCNWGNDGDKISKLPVLCCEMTIGDKRLIEVVDTTKKNVNGYDNTKYEWVKIGEEPKDSLGNKITTFSLGVNPKVDDYIIGTSFKLQNTIDYTMGLDIEGTAIPITYADKLSGKMAFKIIAPYPLVWCTDNTMVAPKIFAEVFSSKLEKYKWSTFILSHVENIIIKDFECKIISDNGGVQIDEDKDLIYQSNVSNDGYINKKDDLEFKFITQLTPEEAFAKGVKNTINVNSVQNKHSGYTLKTLYNALTNETAKPEEHYIDEYFNAYNKPKIILETSLDDKYSFDFRNIYKEKYLNKSFFIQSKSYDLADSKITVKLKQL